MWRLRQCCNCFSTNMEMVHILTWFFLGIFAMVVAADDIELDTYVPSEGYAVICIAIMIGLGIIAALILSIIKGKKAQISDENTQPSTSSPLNGQKPSDLDFNRGKYCKDPKTNDPKNRGLNKYRFPGQQPITSEEKKMFNRGINIPNKNTPGLKYKLEEQNPDIIASNQTMLSKVLEKQVPKINAFGSFLQRSTSAKNRNQSTQGVKKPTEKVVKNIVYANRFNKRSHKPLTGKSKALGNTNARDVIKPTGNVQSPSQSGWDVAAKHFGQSVKISGSNKRIIGGLSKHLNDESFEQINEKTSISPKDNKWKTVKKKLGSTATRDTYVWTRTFVKSQNEDKHVKLQGGSDTCKIESETDFQDKARIDDKVKLNNDNKEGFPGESDIDKPNVPPRQTIQRSLSRTAIGTPEPPNRYSVMSNASVISRQVSCSSILVRTSPDDAKRPESTRPESTMVTVEEQPEVMEEQMSIVEEKSEDKIEEHEAPKGPPPSVKSSNTGKNSPVKSDRTSPPTTNAPLKRTMSKSSIVPTNTDGSTNKPLSRQMSRSFMVADSKPLNRQMSKNVINSTNPPKPMNKQVSRTMSRSVLRLGEHKSTSVKKEPQKEADTKSGEEKIKEADTDEKPFCTTDKNAAENTQYEPEISSDQNVTGDQDKEDDIIKADEESKDFTIVAENNENIHGGNEESTTVPEETVGNVTKPNEESVEDLTGVPKEPAVDATEKSTHN